MCVYVCLCQFLWKPEASDPWSWSHRQCGLPDWVLGTELGSSGRAESILNHRAVSSATLVLKRNAFLPIRSEVYSPFSS